MLVVANGHHWDKRWPEPAFPGADDVRGHPDARPRLPRQRLSRRQGRRRARHGQQRDGHRRRGQPRRQRHAPRRAPRRVDRAEVPLRQAAGPDQHDPARPALAQRARLGGDDPPARRPARALRAAPPDHRFGAAHPTVSGRILDRIIHGAIAPRPNIAQLGPDWVQFADGTRVHADVVIYCTGYNITFPFFDEDFLAAPGNRIDLYRRVFRPGHPSLAFVGLHAAARRDHAARRGAGAVDRRVPARRVPPALAARDGGRHPPRGPAPAPALRRVGAPHDPGRLRHVPLRPAPRAPPRRRPRRRGGTRAAGARSRARRGRRRRR